MATFKWDYDVFDNFGSGGNQMQGRFGALDLPYWTKENRSTVAPAPRLSGNPVPYNATRFYTDGSHWRIRNITVGYTVPRQYLSRLRLNAGEARLYAIAQEPKVFTDYKGPDPENGTAAGAPAFRTLLVGPTSDSRRRLHPHNGTATNETDSQSRAALRARCVEQRLCRPLGKTRVEPLERLRVDTGRNHRGDQRHLLEPSAATTAVSSTWRSRTWEPTSS